MEEFSNVTNFVDVINCAFEANDNFKEKKEKTEKKIMFKLKKKRL